MKGQALIVTEGLRLKRADNWMQSGPWPEAVSLTCSPQQATSEHASWPSRQNFFMAMGGAVSPGDLIQEKRQDCRLMPSTMTSVCL
jgi:hypothetical protein